MESKVTYYVVSVFLFVFTLSLVGTAVSAEDPPCYTFNGDSYLIFALPARFNNRDNVHYQFQFRTTSRNGVLMYARGSYGDFEALYIRGGHLHYHLFNTSPGGIGRQFGAHFVTEEMVSDNTWITVNVYRSWVSDQEGSIHRNSQPKTGMEITGTGSPRSYVDHSDRHGIDLSNTIYFGGFSSSLSTIVGNFTGEIRNITEHRSGHMFENITLNYKSLVLLRCSSSIPSPN